MDNETQGDVTEADKAAVTAFHNKQAARILAGDKTLGDNRDCIEQAFAAHRLASTAQPEVKALVEALEKLEVANERLCAKRSAKTYDAMIHHDGCHDELIALDEARHTGRQALAAYHEAQP